MLFWFVVQIVTDWWKRSAWTTCRIACWTLCGITVPTTRPPSASCSHERSVCCRSCVPSAGWASTGCVSSSATDRPISRPPSPPPRRRWSPPRWPSPARRCSRRSRRPTSGCRLGRGGRVWLQMIRRTIVGDLLHDFVVVSIVFVRHLYSIFIVSRCSVVCTSTAELVSRRTCSAES